MPESCLGERREGSTVVHKHGVAQQKLVIGVVGEGDAVVLSGLLLLDIGVREWLGLIAYRLNGSIDTLLPGPE